MRGSYRLAWILPMRLQWKVDTKVQSVILKATFWRNRGKKRVVWDFVWVLHLSQSLSFPWILKVRQRWICSCMLEGEQMTFFPSSASHSSLSHAKKRLYHSLPRQQKWWQMREVFQETLAATVRVPQGWVLPAARGSPWGSTMAGPGNQGCPTSLARNSAAGGPTNIPKTRHCACPWGWPKAGPSCGLMGGPGVVEAMARQGGAVRSWRPTLLLCCWRRDCLLTVNI